MSKSKIHRLDLLKIACLSTLASGLMSCADEVAEMQPSATVGCEPWATADQDIHANAPSPQLGCSNNMNLLLMLDRPADLVTGRPLGPANGEREAIAVERYKQGQVAPLGNGSSTTQFVISPGASGSQ
jgi:hypothetical protein